MGVADEVKDLAAVSRFSYDFEIVFELKQPFEAVADNRVVVGDGDADRFHRSIFSGEIIAWRFARIHKPLRSQISILRVPVLLINSGNLRRFGPEHSLVFTRRTP